MNDERVRPRLIEGTVVMIDKDGGPVKVSVSGLLEACDGDAICAERDTRHFRTLTDPEEIQVALGIRRGPRETAFVGEMGISITVNGGPTREEVQQRLMRLSKDGDATAAQVEACRVLLDDLGQPSAKYGR